MNGALFSEDRKYRYALWRIWDTSKPVVMFIGLNPSKANEEKTDPTITRVISFSKEFGYGGFYMMNLFAIVSSKPSVLKTDPNPLGENDGWLQKISPKCKDVFFAWGNFIEAKERCIDVINMFPNAYCLFKNKNGTPRHPLYVKGNIQPIKFLS